MPIPGVGPLDGVSFQQTMQMQEYKYQEHIKKLELKWSNMKEELEKMTKGIESYSMIDSEKLKNHQLPLARVKKIMKSDEDVKVKTLEQIVDDKRRSARSFRQSLRNVYF